MDNRQQTRAYLDEVKNRQAQIILRDRLQGKNIPSLYHRYPARGIFLRAMIWASFNILSDFLACFAAWRFLGWWAVVILVLFFSVLHAYLKVK